MIPPAQRSRQGNAALMLMIFLTVFTVTLAIFAYNQAESARQVREGGTEGEITSRNSLTKIESEITELKETISNNEPYRTSS